MTIHHHQNHHNARIVSSVAATAIALACGTNYVYSAWAPQFADKLHLSATQSEVIGLAGNLGMYLVGVPIGMFIDSRGPRPAVLVGSILMITGYLPIQRAYDAGEGWIPWLSFASFLSGLGGCMAFAAAIKVSALNWPHHRGTATAFPLAAFGLSAFFFSLVGSLLFPGSPGKFLLLLSIGPFAMSFIGFFFLRVYPTSTHHGSYQAVPAADPGMLDSQELHRPSSPQAKLAREDADAEPGTLSLPDDHDAKNLPSTSTTTITTPTVITPQCDDDHDPPPHDLIKEPRSADYGTAKLKGPRRAEGDVEADPCLAAVTLAANGEVDETFSLLSSTASSMPGEILVQSSVDMVRSHHIDIRGWALLRNLEFWQLWIIMCILSGIGLMTINNIGNDATALWKHYDDSIDNGTLVLRQQMHVSILSIGSFSGRLLSGVGSDFLVKVLHASRVWCLVIASLIFSLAQICALNIVNPHFLGFVSGFSGLGYGFLFGVYPSIVAESFGIHGLSQNWGFITLAPVLSSNIFNLCYGVIFDAHSIVEDDGQRRCEEGIECYRSAYLLTLAACGLGLGVALYVIWHQKRAKAKEVGKGHAGD
ncbi:MFS general substrate transporter [Xylariaceae sp. FL0255]|nr:MFS general substrate transporter [Xylariaceae sp. FL0255]